MLLYTKIYISILFYTTLYYTKLFCKVHYTRLASPYESDCFPSWSDTNYTVYTNNTSWSYTLMVSLYNIASISS